MSSQTNDTAWMETHGGRQFFFEAKSPEEMVDMIDIEDIAASLSKLCRYLGHTADFYSVAEHSVLLANAVLERGATRQEALTVLLHDAAEAYMGDMPRPMKDWLRRTGGPNLLASLRTLEWNIDAAVSLKYGTIHPFPAVVHDLDFRILRDERTQVMNRSPHTWVSDDAVPVDVRIRCLDHAAAKAHFLRLFRLLSSADGS